MFPVYFVDVNGGWGEWGDWGSCSVDCDGGMRQRLRACDNPLQEGDGDPCDGDFSGTEACNTAACTMGKANQNNVR